MADTAGTLPKIIFIRLGIGKPSLVVPLIVVVQSAQHRHPLQGRPRRCTIRVRIFVLRTTICLTNSVGTPTIGCLAGIGKGRVVVAIMIVVQSVPIKTRPCSIRVRIFVLRTQIMLANTAGTLRLSFQSGIGKRELVAIMIVVHSVPVLLIVFPRLVRLVGWVKLPVLLIFKSMTMPSKRVTTTGTRWPRGAGPSRTTNLVDGTNVFPMVAGGIALIPNYPYIIATRRAKRCIANMDKKKRNITGNGNIAWTRKKIEAAFALFLNTTNLC